MSAQPVDLQIFLGAHYVSIAHQNKKMLLLASAAELEQRLQDLQRTQWCFQY